VVLCVVVLFAKTHEESLNDGTVSGDSGENRHVPADRSGSGTAAGPASWPTAARLPADVRRRVTAAPFQVTAPTWAGAQISRLDAATVSPVSASVEPLTAAVRTSRGPRSSTGPAAVSCRHIVSAVDWLASSNVSWSRPPPVILTCASPLWTY